MSLHRKTAERLVETFGKMKGLPMKVGQILSFMDGVIPVEYQEVYRKTLGTLQVRAAPYSWEQMKITFEEEFGASPDSIFARFDHNPIAAASIGQVYRAQLKDGREVAVKVQYPEIAEALSSDLKNVEVIVKALRAVMPKMDNEQFSQDFLTRFREELDYVREAESQSLFLKRWKGDSRIVIPAPVDDLCRRRVLVTEFQSGKSFAEIAAVSDAQTKSAYGETLFWFVCHSIFSYGLFNADPHPGNFLFQEGARVVCLDFGCVQRYSDESRSLRSNGVNRSVKDWHHSSEFYLASTRSWQHWRLRPIGAY